MIRPVSIPIEWWPAFFSLAVIIFGIGALVGSGIFGGCGL